jgi:hypothetical protein
LDKELTGTEIVPVAVVQVAGDDKEVGSAIEDQVNEVHESFASSQPKLAGGVFANPGQSAQRAIKMDVGGVN